MQPQLKSINWPKKGIWLMALGTDATVKLAIWLYRMHIMGIKVSESRNTQESLDSKFYKIVYIKPSLKILLVRL